MSLDECIPSCSHHCGVFPGTQNPMLHLHIPSSLSPYPRQPLTFSSLQSCLFQNVIAGSIQCVAFSDCLLSLRNTHLRFLHVFSRLDSSFFFFNHWITFYSMDVSRIVYPFIYWKASWLPPHLTMINKAVIKIPVYGGFSGGAVVESPPANAGDTGSCPGLGRSHMLRSN